MSIRRYLLKKKIKRRKAMTVTSRRSPLGWSREPGNRAKRAKRQKTRSRGGAGEEAGKENAVLNAVPLLTASVQFPSRPFRSLQSCRA